MIIYAPTADLLGFFVEVSNEITLFGNSYVILGGDLINVGDPNVEKTCPWSITQPSKAQKQLIHWKKSWIYWMFGDIFTLQTRK